MANKNHIKIIQRGKKQYSFQKLFGMVQMVYFESENSLAVLFFCVLFHF